MFWSVVTSKEPRKHTCTPLVRVNFKVAFTTLYWYRRGQNVLPWRRCKIRNFNSAFFAKRSIKFSKNDSRFSRQTSDNSLKYYLIISFCLSGAISLQQPKSRFFLNSTKEVSLCWYARVNSVVIRFENFSISDRYNPTSILARAHISWSNMPR